MHGAGCKTSWTIRFNRQPVLLLQRRMQQLEELQVIQAAQTQTLDQTCAQIERMTQQQQDMFVRVGAASVPVQVMCFSLSASHSPCAPAVCSCSE